MPEPPTDDVIGYDADDAGADDFDADALARRYFDRPPGSFWGWDVREEALCWAGGTTIAFRAEVERVLERLAPRGLPPFASVALLLAACRKSWLSASGPYREHLWRERRAAPAASVARHLTLRFLFMLLRRLDRVHGLPKELRSSPEAKAVLAELVFESHKQRLAPDHSLRILETFRSGESPEGHDPSRELEVETDDVTTLFGLNAAKISNLLPGLEYVDEDSLRLRLRTGLDAVPEAADVEPPDALVVRRLLAQLRGDPGLAGLSRLATDLMAAVQLPHCVSDLEDLPVGGVSDITNKGPLDRLLLSELAYDDDTLTARIALKEALFLRREHPPQRPPGTRSLLVDVGIRLWGLPRPFATAVALAFAATAGKERVAVYRAGANDLHDVDLRTREGVLTHLEALERTPHPGEVLPRFLARLEEEEIPGDAVLVTHQDTFQDPDFRRVLENVESEFHVATVSGEGTFRLHHVSRRGSHVVREAQLDLEKLFGEPSSAAARPRPVFESLRDPEHDPELPRILSLGPLPLRLPWPADLRLSVGSNCGVLGITRDRRLILAERSDLGAREVTSILPPGPYHWLGLNTATGDRFEVAAFCGMLPRHPLHIVRVRLQDGRTSAIEVPARQSSPLGVTERHGMLFVVGSRYVDGFDLSSGERLCEIEVPTELSYRGGRFFRSGDGQWYALVPNGARSALERVPSVGLPEVVLFDRFGGDGPWIVTRFRTVVSAAKGTGEIRCRSKLLPPSHGHLLGVSHAGWRVAFRGKGARSAQFLVDLGARRMDMVPDALRELETAFGTWRVRSEGMLFDAEGCHAIAVEPEGALCLALGGGAQASLSFHDGDSCWNVRPGPHNPRSFLRWQRFRDGRQPGAAGYTLRVARWPEGSSAFLDSRGLLHLKSSDPAVPEVTVVLCHTMRTAFWSTIDGVRGESFFTGEEQLTPTDGVHSHLRRFTARL